jgi:hypothetical protein
MGYNWGFNLYSPYWVDEDEVDKPQRSQQLHVTDPSVAVRVHGVEARQEVPVLGGRAPGV